MRAQFLEWSLLKDHKKIGIKFEIISIHQGYVSVKGLDFKLAP